MSRVALAVTLSLVVLTGSVGPVVGDGSHAATVTDGQTGDARQYKVSLDNVTIGTWILDAATVRNATIGTVVVRNVIGVEGRVTLTNVTIGTLTVERGRLDDVTIERLVVRNRSVLDVPGGEFFDPDVENRSIERQRTVNATVNGLAIDRLVVNSTVVCADASLGQQADESDATGNDTPALTIQNGRVEQAILADAKVTNWSVERIDGADSLGTNDLPRAPANRSVCTASSRATRKNSTGPNSTRAFSKSRT